MKRYKLIILFQLVCITLNINLTAQTFIKDAVTVNGLQVGNSYPQERIMQSLGRPTGIKEPTASDAVEEYYIFYYGKDRFEFVDGEFSGFRLSNPSFAVNGLVRIGDHISVIDQLEGVKRLEKTDQERIVNWRPKEGGLYDWLSVDFYYDDKGIITEIMAFIDNL